MRLWNSARLIKSGGRPLGAPSAQRARPARAAAVLGAVAVLVAACAPPSSGPAAPGGGAAPDGAPSSGSAQVKRITAALRADLPTLSKTLNTIIPGATALDRLVSSGLTTTDEEETLHPQLAEAVPTIENGLWKVLPDGRMETTWRIRAGARWHDGTAVTADDMAFAVTVGQDRDLPLFRHSALAALERIEASDPSTVTAVWKQPFIDADLLFSHEAVLPLPKHILGPVYLEEKELFTEHAHWTVEFVGSGPFKLREWERGSHATLVANEHYALGRPKVDEIVVRFIPDASTLMANVLAGAVDVTIGERNFSLEEAVQIQWPDGKMVQGDRSPVVAFPQLLNPTPPVLTNVQFRRALYHAIDRQEMANSFMAGQGEVAHAYVSPSTREYRDVQGAAVRYDYDPRRTAQMIESLGYGRGPDGVYSDRGGGKLSVEMRTTTTTENQKAAFSVADYWQRAGVAAEPHVVPLARSQDAEYRASFPSFELIRQPKVNVVTRVHSSRARVPEKNFRSPGGGFNYSRYMNPELDGLIDRYEMTIPWKERMELLSQIIHHLSDQVIIMGMFYSTEANLVNNRLLNASPRRAWNAHEWALK